MPSPRQQPGPPAAWSVSVLLRHRGGLEIRAAAENVVLPGWWGRGGERLSLLLRLRRRLLLSVASHCGDRPAHPDPPLHGGCGFLRFLRGRWARVASVWRRRSNKQPPARVDAAAAVPRGRLAQRPGFSAMAWTPKSAATLRFVVAALAVALASIAVLRLTVRIGCWNWNWRGGRDPEPVARWAKFLELMERAKFLQLMEHPRLHCKYKWLLGVPKRGLEWIFSKYRFRIRSQLR